MTEQTPQKLNLNAMDFANDDVTEEGTKAIRYLTSRLQEAQSNPRLCAIVYEQMQARALFPQVQQERASSLERRELPTREGPNEDQRSSPERRRRSNAREASRAQGRGRRNDANGGSVTHGQSNEDVPPRRRPQRSPNRSSRRRRRSPSYSSSSSSEDKRRHPRHKRRRSPTPPSSSPTSSSTASSSKSKPKRRGHRRSHPAWKRSRRMEKFKEGGKNITFLSYDGTYGATDRILGFIQQFDSAFGGEYFEERSKLRHVAMYFQKFARQWWASLRTRGIAPKTWKECRRAIMKQFLTDEAEDDVLIAWQSLTLEPGESIQKYVDKFWDAHLKATVFKRIEFAEQKQQFCARLPKDLKAYVNAQKPRTISAFIHHTLVASKIFPNALNATKNVNRTPQGDRSHQGNKQTSYHKPQGDKKKDKGIYKGSNHLTSEEMERYCKENKCFKCGEKGHSYHTCPKRTAKKDNLQASMVHTEPMFNQDASRLCYAWGKVRDQDSLILFDPGSTHNFISKELAAKLGIHEHEMGYAMDAEGAFVGQKVPVTPLIGKLCIHVQGYVDRQDFFISPLQYQDVLLGMP